MRWKFNHTEIVQTAPFEFEFAKVLRWRELSKLLDNNSVTSGGRRLAPSHQCSVYCFAACLLWHHQSKIYLPQDGKKKYCHSLLPVLYGSVSPCAKWQDQSRWLIVTDYIDSNTVLKQCSSLVLYVSGKYSFRVSKIQCFVINQTHKPFIQAELKWLESVHQLRWLTGK